MPLLEVACFDANSAITAWQSGADRIELCDNRESGGTTPGLETLRFLKKHVTIPIYIMIRPRGGDFNYTDHELEQMREDVDTFKPYADGFVLGILDTDRKVDTGKTSDLIKRAHPLPCTFHRAFDESQDHFRALEDVVSTGCRAILTSGGAPAALSGASVLAQLVQQARGRITIMPGGGVRASNVHEIASLTKASAYHSSGIGNAQSQPSLQEIRGMKMALNAWRALGWNENDDSGTRPRHDCNGIRRDEQIDLELHVAAVSVGANTPVDELDRHL